MLCSIEIESLRDIPFPDRGIDINRIGNFTHFQITLGEGLILIRMINMYEEKIRSFDKMQEVSQHLCYELFAAIFQKTLLGFV